MEDLPRFSMRINWSDEDKCFIGSCPEFPGATAAGETREEVTRELAIAIGRAVQSHRDEGWPLPEPAAIRDYSGQLRLRLPRTMHCHLAERAATEGVSINTLIVASVAAYLAKKEAAV